jgi:hypothetical protein
MIFSQHQPDCGFNLNTFFDIFMLCEIEFDAQRAIVGFDKESLKTLQLFWDFMNFIRPK